MTRQDLKTGRRSGSRSPWEIGLDAAETGDTQDAARWCEYLRATKGRNVVTRSPSLAARYGDPTQQQLDTLLKVDPLVGDGQGGQGDDDIADPNTDDDGAVEVASGDAVLWHKASNTTTPTGRPLGGIALQALETDGVQAMADALADGIGAPVEVTTHPVTGLPHLRFANPADRERWASKQPRPPRTRRRYRNNSGDGEGPEIDINALGPVARAWFGTQQPTEETP